MPRMTMMMSTLTFKGMGTLMGMLTLRLTARGLGPGLGRELKGRGRRGRRVLGALRREFYFYFSGQFFMSLFLFFNISLFPSFFPFRCALCYDPMLIMPVSVSAAG